MMNIPLMRKSVPFLWLCLLFAAYGTLAQVPVAWKINVAVAPEMKQSFLKGGRLLLHITKQTEREPRNRSEMTVGITPSNWDGSTPFVINTKDKNSLSAGWDKLPENASGKYYFQVVY